jgi:pantothenate kinase
VAPLLDEVWYVEVPDELRQQRLIKRHEQHGRTPEAARQWVQTTDEPNARLIAAHKDRSTCVFRW